MPSLYKKHVGTGNAYRLHYCLSTAMVTFNPYILHVPFVSSHFRYISYAKIKGYGHCYSQAE